MILIITRESRYSISCLIRVARINSNKVLLQDKYVKLTIRNFDDAMK